MFKGLAKRTDPPADDGVDDEKEYKGNKTVNEEVEVNEVILDVVGAIAERGTLQTVTFKLTAVRGQNIRSGFTHFILSFLHIRHTGRRSTP